MTVREDLGFRGFDEKTTYCLITKGEISGFKEFGLGGYIHTIFNNGSRFENTRKECHSDAKSIEQE